MNKSLAVILCIVFCLSGLVPLSAASSTSTTTTTTSTSTAAYNPQNITYPTTNNAIKIGNNHSITSTSPAPLSTIVNSTGIFWGSGFGLKIPEAEVSSATATSQCDSAQSILSSSNNSTTYSWNVYDAYSGYCGSFGGAFTADWYLYLSNVSGHSNFKEVYLSGMFSLSGVGYGSIVFPLILPQNYNVYSNSINATDNSAAFYWGNLTGSSSIQWNSTTKSLQVNSPTIDGASNVPFSYDPSLIGNNGALTNAATLSGNCVYATFTSPSAAGYVSGLYVGLSASSANSYTIEVGIYSGTSLLVSGSSSVSLTSTPADEFVSLSTVESLAASTSYTLAVTTTAVSGVSIYYSSSTGGSGAVQSSCSSLPSTQGTVTTNTNLYVIVGYWQFSETLKATYPDGAPANLPGANYETNGIYTSTPPLTSSGTQVWVDDRSVIYPMSSSSGTSAKQWSATPLTYNLTADWPLAEGSGNYAYDMSNGVTGTIANAGWASCQFSTSCLSGYIDGSPSPVSFLTPSTSVLNTKTFSFSFWQKATTSSLTKLGVSA